MTGTTHIGAGLITGIAISKHMAAPPLQSALIVGAAVAGSLLPDIDTCTSKLGRRIAPVSFAVELVIGHRTLLHSLLPYVLLYILGSINFPDYRIFILSAGSGVLTHLLLDMMNPSGVPLLWPWNKRLHIAPFQTKGIVDRILGAIFLLIAILQATAR